MSAPAAAPAADAAPPAPTGLKAKLPLIAVLVGGLAVGGGTGAVVVGPMVAKKMGRAPGVGAAAAPAADHGDATDDGHGEAEAAEGPTGTPNVHLLENLVINPAGTGGSRYLLVSVAIEAPDAAAIESFKARDAELKDVILTMLAQKSVEQLTDVMMRDSLKAELRGGIVERFGKKTVSRLYFPNYVVQ